jgi:hypothetical protein
LATKKRGGRRTGSIPAAPTKSNEDDMINDSDRTAFENAIVELRKEVAQRDIEIKALLNKIIANENGILNMIQQIAETIIESKRA